MKALSLWQPWASLCLICIDGVAAKGFETRSWATKYRGRLAIHAAKRPMTQGVYSFDGLELFQIFCDTLRDIETFPLGAVLGTVDLVDCHLITPKFVAGLSARERAFGDYTLGRYAWELANPVMFDKPIPAKGAQGLWNWEGMSA